MCEGCFTHPADLGKTKNKRIYIGSGQDGSSDDKISVDLKLRARNTKVQSNQQWKEQGMVKSTFTCRQDWREAADCSRTAKWEMGRETVIEDENASCACGGGDDSTGRGSDRDDAGRLVRRIA